VKEDIDRHYPKLADAGYEITSEATPVHNCIAWAAGDTSRWWECGEEGPIDEAGVYWPEGARFGFGLDALISAYEVMGFELCPECGPEPEAGYDHVALYAENGEWRHAAKRLKDGRWSSKLGDLQDVSHDSPGDVCGEFNGEIAGFMRRASRP
jgi:hypothetical protein